MLEKFSALQVVTHEEHMTIVLENLVKVQHPLMVELAHHVQFSNQSSLR
jgi:hypothetical protein